MGKQDKVGNVKVDPVPSEPHVPLYGIVGQEDDLGSWLDCLTSCDRDLFCMLLGLDGWSRACVNGAARLLRIRSVLVAKRVLDVLDALDTAGMPAVVRFDIWGRLHAPFPDDDGTSDEVPTRSAPQEVTRMPMSSVDRETLHKAIDRLGEVQLEVASLRELIVKAIS